MCFDYDSHPPIAPIAGAAVEHHDLTLTASDGNRLAAFRARPAEPSGAGIVILPDVRGLVPYYEELALRFAETGVDALAIDYYGRSAGPSKRQEGFEYESHRSQVTFEGARADVEAAVAALRDDMIRNGEAGGDPNVEPNRDPALFTVGFCFAGRLSFDAATFGVPLAGVIGFYGFPMHKDGHAIPAPTDLAPQIACPVLGLFGGADQAIPQSAVDEFEKALSDANVEHEVVTYPGAPHSFFDKKATDFREASDDAWRRIQAFISSHSAVAAA